MTQTPCPFCGADIDNDSIFCDQCGAELLKCPKCGSFRKGKFCPACGVPTVKAKDAAESPQRIPTAPPVAPTPVNPVNPPVVSEPRPTTIPPAASVPSRIVCRAMGVSLALQPGAMIGRGVGPYTGQLATFKYISGTHARVDFDGARWTITDVGSRNGTAVNGIPCSSLPMPINVGDVIRFATVYDFNVE